MDMLHVIESFLTETGIAATRFGRDAVRDPRIVLDMRNGRRPGPQTQRRMQHYMSVQRSARSGDRA